MNRSSRSNNSPTSSCRPHPWPCVAVVRRMVRSALSAVLFAVAAVAHSAIPVAAVVPDSRSGNNIVSGKGTLTMEQIGSLKDGFATNYKSVVARLLKADPTAKGDTIHRVQVSRWHILHRPALTSTEHLFSKLCSLDVSSAILLCFFCRFLSSFVLFPGVCACCCWYYTGSPDKTHPPDNTTSPPAGCPHVEPGTDPTCGFEWSVGTGWTSGFFPGLLWQIANETNDQDFAVCCHVVIPKMLSRQCHETGANVLI